MLKYNNNGVSGGLFAGLVAIGLITGCSSLEERKQPNGNQDYQKATLRDATFVVPAGLQNPHFTTEYQIPALPSAAKDQAMGLDVDVRAPVQVFPLVPGSKAEPDGNNMTIWFTARSATQNIDNDVWNALLSFLNRRAINFTDIDPVHKTLDTDWFFATEDLAAWNPDDKTKKKQLQVHQRYRFTIKSDPAHHRTALVADLKDHEAFVKGDRYDHPLSRFDRRRYSAAMLNQVTEDYQAQLDSHKVSVNPRQVKMSLGVDDNDLTAWLVNAPFEITWQRMERLLPTLGFTIKDKTQAKGLMELNYDEPGTSFWQKQDLDPFGLDSGKYFLQYGEYRGKTSITLLDKDKKPVPSSVVSKMYLGISKAFSRQPASVVTK